MSVNEAECQAAGLDPEKVRKLAARLSRVGREASAMGLTVFGGSGSGTLRHADQLVVAALDGGSWDGGDGHERPDADGLARGEI